MTVQYPVFEVFVQWKAGDAFEHVGQVEAPDGATALHLAKEHFVRRESSSGLWVVDRRQIHEASWDRSTLAAGSSKRYRRSLAAADGPDILKDRARAVVVEAHE